MSWTTPRTWTDGEVPTASVMNTHVRDNVNWHYSGDASWTTPTLVNGWSAYDSAGWPVRYRNVGPFTTIQGLVKGGTAGTVPFVLPAGYRPGKNMIFGTGDAAASPAYAELRVDIVGNVIAQAVSSNAWFALHCMFVTEG